MAVKPSMEVQVGHSLDLEAILNLIVVNNKTKITSIII